MPVRGEGKGRGRQARERGLCGVAVGAGVRACACVCLCVRKRACCRRDGGGVGDGGLPATGRGEHTQAVGACSLDRGSSVPAQLLHHLGTDRSKKRRPWRGGRGHWGGGALCSRPAGRGLDLSPQRNPLVDALRNRASIGRVSAAAVRMVRLHACDRTWLMRFGPSINGQQNVLP